MTRTRWKEVLIVAVALLVLLAAVMWRRAGGTYEGEQAAEAAAARK